jgi:predicted DNA-binding transcriptional regulator
MDKDRILGAGLATVSIAVILVYIWLVFFPPFTGIDVLLLKLTGSVAVAGLFGILAWIGYTLATTPPPKPIEEIEKELEKESEKMEKDKGEEAGEEKK